ncbi:MFS transporter [Saccharopolyspora spinosa]|uniref:MFS family arabinose efflux permease n=1 Tax=Saccharopolyspora spinosa TaxID=60894 RepID=A0A2N3Y667_SACSN|nr:MFS transporter [Saccharopolyspora spinosa]PKW18414.1 putative MFS family arabinose efflux permease [Saccharopolyspora spinosa]
MWRRASLGRAFGWLWAAYAVSAYGTGLGFGAFSVVAIMVLNASSAEVAALSSSGLAIGALVAVPLGPWMEFRAKRPVMIVMDVVRFAALASIPLAYCLGALSFAQLLVVSIVTAAAKIAFTAASGAYLKTIVPADGLLVATSRFESTTWSATIIGPPVGGAAIGLLGPVTTVVVDAASYLLSALGIIAIRKPEQPPNPGKTSTRRWSDIVEGWRYILAHHTLRRFFFNTMLVNGLIMATEPLLSVLMLSHLRFPVWEFGLAFAVPCIGGLIGSRLARRIASHCGEHTVLRVFGTLRACWPLGLAFIQPSLAGLVIVMVTQFGLIICASIFNPVFAAYRLNNTDTDRHARVLTAWSISTSTSIAVITMLWGLLAQLTSPRTTIALAGVLLLGTPFLLPRHVTMPKPASPIPPNEESDLSGDRARA